MHLDLKVTGEFKHIEKVLELAYQNTVGKDKPTGYRIVDGQLQIMQHIKSFHGPDVPINAFLAVPSTEHLAQMVTDWLNGITYPLYSGHADDWEKGFKAEVDADGDWSILITFEPYWIEISK
jgi:hypothetical protein